MLLSQLKVQLSQLRVLPNQPKGQPSLRRELPSLLRVRPSLARRLPNLAKQRLSLALPSLDRLLLLPSLVLRLLPLPTPRKGHNRASNRVSQDSQGSLETQW